MSVEVVEGAWPGWSVSEVKQIVCRKEWATNKANDVYNAPEECLHDGLFPPLIPHIFPHSYCSIFLLTTWIYHQAQT